MNTDSGIQLNVTWNTMLHVDETKEESGAMVDQQSTSPSVSAASPPLTVLFLDTDQIQITCVPDRLGSQASDSITRITSINLSSEEGPLRPKRPEQHLLL